jgi:dTDP-4-dehydrorhamnose reductase
MKILITGANGMLARAATEYCRLLGDEVAALSRTELDISDRDSVFSFLQELKPEYVLNCAAYTDVDGAEANKTLAYAANAEGVNNLALACKAISAGFITVSTDYVFNGENFGFYTQRHTPDPRGIYAQSKLEGEQRARDAYGRSIIVRSGWIYGPGGTNFLSVMPKLLAEGKAIKAIADAFGTPTYAVDLAIRIRELAKLDLPAIFHVTNEGPGVSFLEFAEKVCEIAGFDTNLIEPVSIDALQRPAPRPRSSRLACLFSERFGLGPLPNWETALKHFLDSTESLATSN